MSEASHSNVLYNYCLPPSLKGDSDGAMASNVNALASRVVIVSNETYKAKADGRQGGVGWETMIIQGDLAQLPADSTKYQVIVRSESLNDGLPLYLKTRYAFHSKPSNNPDSFREELVIELLDLPLDERLEARECYL